MAALSSRAFSRGKSGFRPNTQRNNDSMFKLFSGFCVFSNVSVKSLTVGTIMPLLEFLVGNGASYASVANPVSAKISPDKQTFNYNANSYNRC